MVKNQNISVVISYILFPVLAVVNAFIFRLINEKIIPIEQQYDVATMNSLALGIACSLSIFFAKKMGIQNDSDTNNNKFYQFISQKWLGYIILVLILMYIINRHWLYIF